MPCQFFKLCFTLENQLTHTQLFLLKKMKNQKRNNTGENRIERARRHGRERGVVISCLWKPIYTVGVVGWWFLYVWRTISTVGCHGWQWKTMGGYGVSSENLLFLRSLQIRFKWVCKSSLKSMRDWFWDMGLWKRGGEEVISFVFVLCCDMVGSGEMIVVWYGGCGESTVGLSLSLASSL